MRSLLCLLGVLLLLVACNNGESPAIPTPVVEVVMITATSIPQPPTEVPSPTNTPIPEPTPTLVSRTANGSSTSPVISGDGRYVVFESLSNNVSPDARQTPCDVDLDGHLDNKCRNIYLYDRELDETELISVGRNNFPAEGSSFYPSLSDDASHIAFMSIALNLDENDESFCFNDEIRAMCMQIFLRDRTADETRWISRAVDGGSPDGNSYLTTTAALSADGRYLVYMSYATNLVADDTNEDADVFLYDRTTEQTRRISLSGAGEQGDGPSYFPYISGNGEYVVFISMATNLVPNDTNDEPDVFVYALGTNEVTRVSVASDGTEADAFSDYPAISDDGRYITFESTASNLVEGDSNNACELDGDMDLNDNCRDIFLHDRQTGETTRLSVDSEGVEGNYLSMGAYLAGDSSTVVFASLSVNLVSRDRNGAFDLFIRDPEGGTTTRVALTSDGEEGNHHSGITAEPVNERPSFGISDDGRFIVFSSSASNFVADDRNDPSECRLRIGTPEFAPECNDVFLHDRETGETILISSVRKVR